MKRSFVLLRSAACFRALPWRRRRFPQPRARQARRLQAEARRLRAAAERSGRQVAIINTAAFRTGITE
jgi:hypothetical protein